MPWRALFRKLKYVSRCIPLVGHAVFFSSSFIGDGGVKQYLLLDDVPALFVMVSAGCF